MGEETAIMLLEHTCYDDFNLLDHQIKGRLEAIQVLIKQNQQLKEELQKANDTLDTHNELIRYQKSLLDEIREFTDNHIMLIYTKNAPREMVGMKELLQILDKVKE